MARANCGKAERGSQKWLQILVNDRPELIIAFGDIPFLALLNRYILDVSEIRKGFKDWIFFIENKIVKTVVVRLYNPGQGYRTARNIHKKIKENVGIGPQWVRFLPDDMKSERDLAEALKAKYASANHIDPNNFFYDAMFDMLIKIAGQKIHWLR